jgi:hypothetical protein
MGFWSKLFGTGSPAPTEKELKKSGTEPWADLQFSDGKLVIVDYNQAFVTKIRSSFGDLIDDVTSDEDVVKLYVDRENVDREEPRLEVVHLGIEADGQLKIKLDWNKAFINHLHKNGISGETEDEAIKAYLARLTTETADAEGELPDLMSREQINEAFRDIDNVAQRELDEAASQIKKPRGRRKKVVS